jgi:hypothetical protein
MFRRCGGFGRVAGREGFVVFGIIIGIVATITGAVLLGMLIDRAKQQPPAPPEPREVRYATAPLEIRFGALVAARVAPGQPLWVRGRGDGELLVFESARSNRIIGFVADEDLSVSPPQRGWFRPGSDIGRARAD